MDWRVCNGTPVYLRKIFDWAVPREKRCCLLVRSGRSRSHSPYLDVLPAQVFLLGAEFTYLYAHHYGSRTSKNEVPASRLPQEQLAGEE
jgi:hypothetical protein